MAENRQLRLSSGNTLLNLACSGNPRYAMVSGGYYWIVGDSDSGKTVLTLTFLAQASINKEFDDYDLIFDDVEGGALMDVEKFFGPKLAARIQPPSVDGDKNPVYSRTIEDLYFHLEDRIERAKKRNRPFIYLLDSMDGLDSEQSEKKFQERRTAKKKGKLHLVKGDYGDGKAKINSTHIRGRVEGISATNSILIVLSQTRDNIEAGPFQNPSTSAGGRALKFYATWQMWSSCGPQLKREVDGKDYQIGITSNIHVKKNRLSGKEWRVQIPIYWSIGMDDLGSCVDFLVDSKHWAAEKGVISATEFDLDLKKEPLIAAIEERGLEFDLREIVAGVWKQIEARCVVQRKSPYH